MQDEVNTKVVALSIRAGTQSSKITAKVLKAAMQKFLAELEKAKTTQTSKTCSVYQFEYVQIIL